MPPESGSTPSPPCSTSERAAVDLDGALDSARLAAAAAAAVQLEALRSGREVRVETKQRSDFVTEADLAAQDAILSVLRERHPDHAVLGEEMDPTRQAELARGGGPLWVVDPIDGTTNFVHGHPFFGASVALVHGGRALVGAVDAPLLHERWWAAAGAGAWTQRGSETPEQIRASERRTLDQALVATGFPFKALDRLRRYRGEFERVLSGTAGIRRCGAAAVDLCYLACGRVDAFWEAVLKPWDIAAGAVIVREAGGIIERIDGTPLTLESGDVIAAGTVEALEGLRSLLRGPTGDGSEPD